MPSKNTSNKNKSDKIKSKKTTRKYNKKAGDSEDDNNLLKYQQFKKQQNDEPNERIKQLEERQTQLEERQKQYEQQNNELEPIPQERKYEPEYEEPIPQERKYEPKYEEPIPQERKYEPEYEEPMPQERKYEPEYEEPIKQENEYEQDEPNEPDSNSSIQPTKNIKFLIFSIIGTIIGLVIFGVGLYILFRPQKYSNLLSANITAASCEPGTSICYIDIKYKVNNADYVKTKVSVKSLYKSGDSIDILYDSSNPDNFIIAQPKWIRIVIGTIFLLIASILLFIIWWNYYRKH